MSKGLNSLDTMVKYLSNDYANSSFGYQDYKNIRNSLKALEIIKEKDVDIVALKISINLKQYNCKEDGRCPLTQEDYDLLKKVLL